MIDRFKELLISTQRKGIDKLLDYMENETDFFSAWASTSFHCNYDGGLLEHSLNVCEYALRLKDAWDSPLDKSSIIITACLHDV